MRLFIGIALDDGLKDYIDYRKEKIEPYVDTGRFTYCGNLHLTLKFLGEASEAVMVQVADKLPKLAAVQRSIDVHLGHLGIFQKRNKAILWLGIQESQAIIELYNRIEEIMEECGFERDSRPYTPHITLGRGIRFNQDFEKVKESIHIKHECIHIRKVTLFESTRVRGKLTYVPLMTVKLK